LRLVINQPDPVSKIAIPTLAMMLETQIAMKAALERGPQREGATLASAAEDEMSALKSLSATRSALRKCDQRQSRGVIDL
jgi:hypothetical protein